MAVQAAAMRSLLALLLVLASPLHAETLRVATFEPGLSRDGAGVLLGDLTGELDPDVVAALAVIRTTRPDVLLLTRFDHDPRGRALAAFAGLLRDGTDGIDYPHSFQAPVNAGLPSGLDLDGDGLVSGWNDALGWGKYPGHGGMAILSRLPLDAAAARTFRDLRWADLPGATLPAHPDGRPWPDPEAAAAFRLSSRSHWDVPVILPDGSRLHLLAANPTPPLFDGDEALNRLRNRDEIRFWSHYLDGMPFTDDAGISAAAPESPVVVLGNFNADPVDGAGFKDGIGGLLAHPRLQDPRPSSPGAATAANPEHSGPPELDTADWNDGPDGPGNLRVDYVLPDVRLGVQDAGVVWPIRGDSTARSVEMSAHRLVWVDIALP